MSRPTIEAAFYVLNEERGLERAIKSALAAGVDSVMVWDTGSMDGTLDIARKYARRIYTLRVPEEAVDFGMLETMVCHLAKADWVLRLDGDEAIRSEIDLHDLCDDYYGVWSMARYRWADLDRNVQLEREAFPDLQYRFFKNDGLSRYVGLLHPVFESPHPIGQCEFDIAVLDHFVDPLHLADPERVARRNRLYQRLAGLAGKRPEGSDEGMRLAGHQQ